MIVQALTLTLRLALLVSALLLVLGTPIAYWLAYSRWRGKFFVEALVSLPLVLPPTVLGFYVLVASGPLSPGRSLVSVADRPHARVQLRRTGRRVGSLQPALRGAAHGGCVLRR